jgi:hypothetical protein
MKARVKVYEQQVKPGWGFWAFFAGFGFFTVVANSLYNYKLR